MSLSAPLRRPVPRFCFSEIMRRCRSVEAGGAFSLLVKDRGDLVPELTDIRRFSSEWEKAASIELRAGNTSAIDAYEAHDRVMGA